jgi:hypothetical protein
MGCFRLIAVVDQLSLDIRNRSKADIGEVGERALL